MMQIEHDKIKSPDWREAAPAGYLQAWRRIRTRDDREQIQQVARARIEPGTAGLRFRRADYSATLPSLTVNDIVSKKQKQKKEEETIRQRFGGAQFYRLLEVTSKC